MASTWGFGIGFVSKGFGAQLGFGESMELCFGKVPDLRRWYYIRDQLRSGLSFLREKINALPSAPGQSAS
jgi:hypothetical protein